MSLLCYNGYHATDDEHNPHHTRIFSAPSWSLTDETGFRFLGTVIKLRCVVHWNRIPVIAAEVGAPSSWSIQTKQLRTKRGFARVLVSRWSLFLRLLAWIFGKERSENGAPVSLTFSLNDIFASSHWEIVWFWSIWWQTDNYIWVTTDHATERRLGTTWTMRRAVDPNIPPQC